MLQLKTSLQNGDVIMVPPIKEGQKLLQAFVKNVAESSRAFVRWMDGTCLEMPDQRQQGDTDGDPLVMHFSSEVLRMQQVRVMWGAALCRSAFLHGRPQDACEKLPKVLESL